MHSRDVVLGHFGKTGALADHCFIIHFLGGGQCPLIRDSEPIRLLEMPTSPSLYVLMKFIPRYCCMWIADVFRLLINDIADVFCSFPVVKEHQRVSNEGITGGKWVFLCLEGGYHAIFRVYRDLVEAPQTWKVLEFCPDQM